MGSGDAIVDVGTEQKARSAADAVSLLTVYVVLLFAVPSRLVFAPLGGAGTPALMVGVGAALWWVWYHLHRSTPLDGPTSSVRRTIGFFCIAVLTSYAAAMTRPILVAEVSTADLGLVALVGWAGVALLAHDGIPSLARLEVFVNRIAVAGGAVALLGILQFFTKQSWIDQIDFPGLSTNATLNSVLGRNGFARPAGTAIHPIEFGVMMTIVLPLALHRAFHGPFASSLRRWWPALALAAAIPLSISRSALLGAAIVLIVLLPTWPKARRRLTIAFIAALFTLIFVTIPGMMGTLTTMFTGISEDSSAQSRTDSYGLALEFAARDLLIGRGISTFLPSYRILDNQYLLLLIEVGVIGLVAMVAMLMTAFVAAVRARRLTSDPSIRDLCQCIAAAVAAAAISLALFDALSFPMAAGLLFLVTGLAGAVASLVRRLEPVG
ncbi:hypothetical protein ASE38_01435 [Cellulomonas sp. Root930]|nr:hypothetical protein ASE38_01435 [Cellulomonas sp. Root930]